MRTVCYKLQTIETKLNDNQVLADEFSEKFERNLESLDRKMRKVIGKNGAGSVKEILIEESQVLRNKEFKFTKVSFLEDPGEDSLEVVDTVYVDSGLKLAQKCTNNKDENPKHFKLLLQTKSDARLPIKFKKKKVRNTEYYVVFNLTSDEAELDEQKVDLNFYMFEVNSSKKIFLPQFSEPTQKELNRKIESILS